jgi:hypothetical protein
MDEVERNIRSLPDEDLIEIVRVEFEEYTDAALAIARDEMSKRGIPEEEEPAEDEDAEAAREEPNRAESLESILRNELQYEECCDAIMDFVTSMNIRCGEYEGVHTVIKKMDRENFLLFSEEVTQKFGRVILGCVAARKGELVEWIERIAGENGFGEEEEKQEEY